MSGSNSQGLSRFFNVPGGITVEDGAFRAELRTESLREKSMAEVDESVRALGAILEALRGEPTQDIRDEMQRISSTVVALAGTFSHKGLTQAAFSLCELLDWLETHSPWDRLAVDVHYNAMRLLRESPSQVAEEELIAGLRRVVRCVRGAER